MARLGGRQGGLDGLLVAHLPHQDHVGILAQDPAQRALERGGIEAHLTLVDDRLLVGVQVLDRVLDRHDVLRAGLVDVVDHRGQRGGLARAGGAGEQHDPALLLGQPPDHRWEIELVHGADRERDRPADQRDRPALAEGVDAEARQALDRVREVDLPVLFELLQQPGLADHVLHRALGVLGREGLGALDGQELAVHAHHRRSRDLHVQVRPLRLDHPMEGFVDVEHRLLNRHRRPQA